MDDVTRAKIADRINRGEAEGFVAGLRFRVNAPAGYLLPAIASYVRKGTDEGRLMGHGWSFEVREEAPPLTLRERAVEIVRANALDEGLVLEEDDFNYAVEQVRTSLEIQEHGD
jgi:hypothetical protein